MMVVIMPLFAAALVLRRRYFIVAPRLLSAAPLVVSRDAVAAGEEQLVSFSAEQSKYFSICTVTLDPGGDLPFTSWGRR